MCSILMVISGAFLAHYCEFNSSFSVQAIYGIDSPDLRSKAVLRCSTILAADIPFLLQKLNSQEVAKPGGSLIESNFILENGDRHVAMLLLQRANCLTENDIDVIINHLSCSLRKFSGRPELSDVLVARPCSFILYKQGPRAMNRLIMKMGDKSYPSQFHDVGLQVLERYYGYEMMLIRFDYELSKIRDRANDPRYANITKLIEDQLKSKKERPKSLDAYLNNK